MTSLETNHPSIHETAHRYKNRKLGAVAMSGIFDGVTHEQIDAFVLNAVQALVGEEGEEQ